MVVNGKQQCGLYVPKDYAAYNGIKTIINCVLDIRNNKCTLFKINWMDTSFENMISFNLFGKTLLSLDPECKFCYTADCKINVRRKEDNKFVIVNIEIKTDECVAPAYTKRIVISGKNIDIEKINSEEGVELDFNMLAPDYNPITAYYYDKMNNTFKEVTVEENIEAKNTLMIDIDDMTLDLIKNLDPKGRDILNRKLSTKINDTVLEVYEMGKLLN